MTPRGACPTLTAPMQTGDGLLVRLALARPGLTPVALSEIAQAAAEHGNGLIDITQRGNIQIRGLTAASAPALAARVEALDILAPDIPAIAVNTLVDVDPGIRGDPLAIAAAIRGGIGAMVLAPKTTVVIDGGGLFPLDTQAADIRLVAVGNQWQLSVGGVPVGMVDEAGAAPAVLLQLQMLASEGPTARARSHALPASQTNPVIGRHALSDGHLVLGMAMPFGRVEASILISLSQHAEDLGASTLCPAPDRALLITGLAPDRIEAMAGAAAALGLILDAEDPRLGIAACTGKPACASGYFDTRALAQTLADRLPGSRIHVSGCAKGCACPSATEVVLVGQREGIGVIRNGRANDIPLAVLPHSDPSALTAFLEAHL